MVVSCESELGDGGLLMFVVERDFGLLWLWMSVTWKPLSKASFGILWSFTTPDVCVLYLHNPTWVINTIIVILIWFCFALAFPRLHKTFITDRGRPYTDTPFVIPPGILKSSQPERDDPNLCMVLHLNTFNIYIYIFFNICPLLTSKFGKPLLRVHKWSLGKRWGSWQGQTGRDDGRKTQAAGILVLTQDLATIAIWHGSRLLRDVTGMTALPDRETNRSNLETGDMMKREWPNIVCWGSPACMQRWVRSKSSKFYRRLEITIQ